MNTAGAQDGDRRVALALMALAVVIGAALRSYNLGASEMTPDEAASWAAAAAPTVRDVLHRQAVLNPGKLAAYDLVLHGWIALFGSGLTAMRTLSSLLGVAAIGLTFWVARELLAMGERDEGSAAGNDFAAALAALIFAATLTMIRFARECRMYPLLIASLLAETGFLLRSHRRGGFANYAGVLFFTALSIATHFTAVFAIAAQALWLIGSREGRREGLAWKPLAALAAGVIVLAPILADAIVGSVGAMDQGAINWIPPPRSWEVFSIFNRATGTLPFPVLLALAVWGAVSQWPRLRDAFVFALFWMYGPVLMLYLVSLTVTPLLVERYALSSFVPFFILAGAGIAACASWRIRAAAIALVLALSIGHTAAFLREPPSRQWIHAARMIKANTPSAEITVAPPHGANLLRYYLTRSDRYKIGGVTRDSCAHARILLLWDHALEGPTGNLAAACRFRFPHIMFNEKDLAVRSR